MHKNHIYQIIKRYFENSYSQDLQNKFRRWLISPDHAEEKESSLHEIWNSVSARADRSTREDLDLLHKKLDITPVLKARTISLRYIARIAAIIVIPLLCSTLTYYFTKKYAVGNASLIEHFVPYGDKQLVVLPDNSQAWVNAGSMLIYPEKFSGDTRTVYLNGEANFSVAKDPEKPFIVSTNRINIEALGTVFNVQAYLDLPKITATLEEGKIRVETKSEHPQSLILLPNEQITYDHKTQLLVKKTVDARRVAMWKEGYLIFQEASLVEILRALEKRYNIVAQFDSGKYEGRTYTVRFSPEESLQETLDVLKEIIGGFNYKIKENTIYIL